MKRRKNKGGLIILLLIYKIGKENYYKKKHHVQNYYINKLSIRWANLFMFIIFSTEKCLIINQTWLMNICSRVGVEKNRRVLMARTMIGGRVGHENQNHNNGNAFLPFFWEKVLCSVHSINIIIIFNLLNILRNWHNYIFSWIEFKIW